jgi:DNA polymerase delta subunit 1
MVGITAVVSCVVLNRRSLWGYKGDEQVPFIKITCTDQKAIPKVRDKSNSFSELVMDLL